MKTIVYEKRVKHILTSIEFGLVVVKHLLKFPY
jgi:hypothetical protein